MGRTRRVGRFSLSKTGSLALSHHRAVRGPSASWMRRYGKLIVLMMPAIIDSRIQLLQISDSHLVPASDLETLENASSVRAEIMPPDAAAPAPKAMTEPPHDKAPSFTTVPASTSESTSVPAAVVTRKQNDPRSSVNAAAVINGTNVYATANSEPHGLMERFRQPFRRLAVELLANQHGALSMQPIELLCTGSIIAAGLVGAAWCAAPLSKCSARDAFRSPSSH